MKWELAWTDDTVKAWKNSKTGAYICDFGEDDKLSHSFSSINELSEMKELSIKKLAYYKRKEFFIPSAVLKFELTDKEALFSLETVYMLVEREKADKVAEEFLKAKNEAIRKLAEEKETLIEKKKALNKEIKEINLVLECKLKKFDNTNIKELEELLKFTKQFKNNLALNKFKFTQKNIEAKKENKEIRKKIYIEQIDQYIKEHKKEKITIKKLTEDLNINRKTFYNLKLNEYLKLQGEKVKK